MTLSTTHVTAAAATPEGASIRTLIHRGGSAFALLAFTVGLLSGCGGPPVAATEAVSTYDALAEDLLAAADTVRPMDWELQRNSRKIEEPGAEDCRYRPGSWMAGEDLYPAPGQGMDWQPWRDALDPVLEEHGFDAFGRERRRGAQYYVTSDGPHGATVELTVHGDLRISDVRVDATPCEDATLGL